MGSDVLDDIKSKLDIVELVSDYVPLKRAGHNYKGICPFHAEKTPSFMVSPEKQIFHCFGCGAGGDAFGFIMKQENLSFQEALRFLAEKTGVKLGRQEWRASGEKEDLRAVQKEALDFYRERLKASGRASTYLSNRGLSERSLRDFSLGFAPEGWRELYGRLKGKGFKDGLLLQSGLVAAGQKGPYDIFRSRVMFPIEDVHGGVIAFGGRVMEEGQPKYLNSPETPIFRKSENLYALGRAKDEIKRKGQAVVVEGYLDAIMCHQCGIRNVVAPLGTALTAGHLKKLGRYSDTVVLVFDGDEAGVFAAKRSLPLILEHELRARILLLPEGEDPDSILRGKGAESLERLLLGAYTPVEFILRTAKGRKTDAVKEAIGVISAMKDPISRDEFVTELSDRAGVGESAVREALQRAKKGGRPFGTAPEARLLNEESLLLSAIVHVPEKIHYILEKVPAEDLRDGLIRGIFVRLAKTPPGASVLDAAATEEEKALVSGLALKPGFDLSSADRNIEDCIRRIKLRRLEEAVKEAKKAGDLGLLTGLLRDKQILMKGAV